MRITEPGLYPDLSNDDYQAQVDWLSWSRMKFLIPPSTPAHFKAALDAPREHKRHYELGHVVHRLVLGEGEEYVVVQALNRSKEPYDATDYATKSAQDHRDAIRDSGRTPVLRHELDAAEKMAAAIKDHPTASALLSRPGRPEVSLFWVDPATGVKCRARVDYLPDVVEKRRLIVADVKTTAIESGASPAEFSRTTGRLAYYGQRQHYLDGLVALGLDPDPAWLFVVVETTAPYLVSVGQLAGADDLRLARATVDHCRRLYAECLAADRWPGYGDGIQDLSLPSWLHCQMEEALS